MIGAHDFKCWNPGAAILIAVHIWASAASAAAPPRLVTVLPRGGQRGTEVTVTFSGERLEGAQKVLWHESGIATVSLEQADDANVRCVLRIAPDCTPGLHRVRLWTVNGVSNLLLFSVGTLPEIGETEPNNSPAAPQAIALPACVNGSIPPEDVDVFALQLVAGQVLAVEVEALRLGDALFDPRIAVLDAAGREVAVADDTPLLSPDASLVYKAGADGTYFVQVRETAYGGGGNFRYRLHIGGFPRALAWWPTGLSSGASAELTAIGDPTGAKVNAVAPSMPGWMNIHAQRDGLSGPTGLPVRVVAGSVSIEGEPNETVDQATTMIVPGGACGTIQSARDVDLYTFNATAGQAYDVRVYARAIGSSLDSWLAVRRPSGEGLGGSDDVNGLDSSLRFTAPAAEPCIIEVRDLLMRGGAEFPYFLEVSPVQPALGLTVSGPDARVTVPAGNRAALLLSVNRQDVGGAVKVECESLPPGMSASVAEVHPGTGQVPVIFEAASDAAPVAQLTALKASIIEPAGVARGGLSQSIEMVRYENNPFYATMVDRLAVCIAHPVPLRVEAGSPAVPLVQMGSMLLPVRIERAEGFQDPVNVRLLWNPPGVGSGAVDIPGDKSEAALPINAAGNAAIGKWTTVVVATTGGGASIEVASAPVMLEIAEPWVQFAVQKTRVEQGQPVEVVVKLSPRASFEGSANARLVGLPGKITVDPLTFTAAEQELRFQLNVPPDAPPGEHGMFISAEIPVNGQIVAHGSSSAPLMVDRPLPPKDPQKEQQRLEAQRKAEEEKARRKAERIAALEARRKEAESQRSAVPQP